MTRPSLSLFAAALLAVGAPLPAAETEPAFDEAGDWLERSPSAFAAAHRSSRVAWRPWSAETLAAAQREGKPLFIHVGEATNGLAQAMKRESFGHEEIADILNADFVPTLVDRLAQPELAAFLAAFAKSQLDASSFPLNLWATPDGRIFDGGGYYPSTDEWGSEGFPSKLEAVRSRWKENRDQALENAAQLDKAFRAGLATGSADSTAAPESLVAAALDALASDRADANPGYQSGPRLPARQLAFLARAARSDNPERALRAAKLLRETLEPTLASALQDHVGGGFFAEAAMDTWELPVFSKRLADQARMIEALAQASSLDASGYAAETLRRAADGLLRAFAAPQGGFLAALDSLSPEQKTESLPAEGLYYLMAKGAIERVLDPEDAAIVCAQFGIEAEGNLSEEADVLGQYAGLNVFRRGLDDQAAAARLELEPGAVAQARARSLPKLAAYRRTEKPRPDADPSRVVEFNADAAAALVAAAQATGDERYLAAARQAYQAVAPHASGDGARRLAAEREPGAESASPADRAAWGQASLRLHQATGEDAYLEAAIAAAEAIEPALQNGVAVLRSPFDDLVLPALQEAEAPSATARALELFDRLAAAGQETFADKAAAMRQAIHPSAAAKPLERLGYIAAIARLPQSD